ncbi:MAG: hypothetical protein ACE5LU_02905 [Anaerolineae bacterium]
MPMVTIHTQNISRQEARRLLRAMVENFDASESLQEVIADLTAYEIKYGLSTLQFYPQFIAGRLGDSSDFMLWAGLYEAYVELTQPHLLAQAAA